MAMRVTSHNGRAGKDGAYSSRHNDRQFDLENAKHIDPDRSTGNRYWCYYEMPFDDAEAYYYETHFRESLDARNMRYINQRHPERVRSMEQYRKSEKTCPEETILQVGKADETIDPNLLWKIVSEHIQWEMKTYPCVQLLDVALHVDEEGAPHIHERKVWVGHDKDGLLIVGQNKALEEMGIQPPEPNKKISRYNNAKVTYTKQCREHLIEVARSHGLDVETTPLEHSKVGLALEEYQARRERERAEQARQEAREALRTADQIQEQAHAVQTVETTLSDALEAAKMATSVDIEVLERLPLKRSITGKITPSRVLVYEDDLDRLRDQARAAESIAYLADQVRSDMRDLQDAADIAVRRDAKIIELTHDALMREQVLREQQHKIADLQREIRELRAERDDMRKIIDTSPELWEQMQSRARDVTQHHDDITQHRSDTVRHHHGGISL